MSEIKTKYKLNIAHLYPSHLNLYGDIGNIMVLKQRCLWRNIEVVIFNINKNDQIPDNIDIFFIGGGQDSDEFNVYQDLIKNKLTEIEKNINHNKVFLLVCAGLQLFGKFFIGGKGEEIKGLGFLDLYTKAPNDSVKDRCIGNIITKLNPDIFTIKDMPLDTLVGFENHIGQTYLGNGVKPLSFVVRGKGNNVQDNTEGAVFKNIYASYSHGPLLPKNPHLADFILTKALETKYKEEIFLPKINDKEEIEAHKYILGRFSGLKT